MSLYIPPNYVPHDNGYEDARGCYRQGVAFVIVLTFIVVGGCLFYLRVSPQTKMPTYREPTEAEESRRR